MSHGQLLKVVRSKQVFRTGIKRVVNKTRISVVFLCLFAVLYTFQWKVDAGKDQSICFVVIILQVEIVQQVINSVILLLELDKRIQTGEDIRDLLSYSAEP